jgi:hypothetical protein
MFKYYYELFTNLKLNKFGCQMFGIVMQPNNIINNITNKYWIKKCEDLFLYQISYKIYLKNIKSFDKFFGKHFFVSGYKNLILESTQIPIKLCHLATLRDLKYIKILQPMLTDIEDYEIMFCLPSKIKFVDNLKDREIFPSSTMTIFSLLNLWHSDWKFIRTYMI